MISELHSIRIEALTSKSNHGLSCLRKCPHCGQVRSKVEGCDGQTTCGERPSSSNDMRDPSYAVMSTFTFHWNAKKLSITKSGSKAANKNTKSGQGIGCGKSVIW